MLAEILRGFTIISTCLRKVLHFLTRRGATPANVNRIGQPEQPSRSCGQMFKAYISVTAIIMIWSAATIGHHCRHMNARQERLVQEFRHTYSQQYFDILYVQVYFENGVLDTNVVLRRICSLITLHQDPTRQQLEVLLHNSSANSAIVLLGPSGVGKSMFTGAQQGRFPWEESIHYDAWNMHLRNDAKKVQMLRLFVPRLNGCGPTPMTAENLSSCDRELMPLLKYLIPAKLDVDRKRVIMLRIVNLNGLDDANVHQQQFKNPQLLPHDATGRFRIYK